jgi:hypothetical protein
MSGLMLCYVNSSGRECWSNPLIYIAQSSLASFECSPPSETIQQTVIKIASLFNTAALDLLTDELAKNRITLDQ